MFQKLSETINEVVSFTNQHRIKAKFNIHQVGDLRNDNPDKLWASFEKKPGVYVLFSVAENTVHYVGMSERDVGTRLYGWLFKENKVNEALADKDLVLTINLSEEPYMSPALESFLIGKLNPVLNVRNVA
ncbi:hypothetical protein SN10_21120 [Vibrio harveyi]|nr:hypothetical protein SN10_21120 [Vibrio harveyi]